jgi:membrane-associated phospholipid phosphatase
VKKIGTLILFGLIGFVLTAQNWDARLLQQIHTSEARRFDSYQRFVSDSYLVGVLGTPLVAGGIWLHSRSEKDLNIALEITVSTMLNYGLTQGLKYTINRQRPYDRYMDIRPKSFEDSPSFPSGHTSTSFATATALSLSYPKWYVAIPAYAWAGSVAYSRMHLGVHYPSDVLAGALLGAGSAWFTHWINQKLKTPATR